MARPQRLGLSAVRSEGAILPPSILQRIHREDPSLGGMTPDDFGLSGMRVREAASQAWNALQAPWRAFQAERARLAPGEAGTGMTRSRWLNQIAKALDYGAIDPLRGSVEVGDRSFALSHLYRQVPIHWVGCGLELDRPTAGEKGAAKMSPHGLVQLLLNASDNHLWGFVSNGLQWRILRDDNSLSRQSMVEFDLEAIFEGQLYDEFLLFYLLCHQTRVKAEKPDECWLERWSQAAANEGKRALDTLRNGVEEAIETLGQGFLKHPSNHALRQSLRDGKLDKQGYYRQLLRLVYRLLFLFVAEDRVDAKGRSLLHLPEATDEARSLYAEFYSTQRLRLLAERLRGSHRHHDLFQQLRLVLGKLGEEDGCPELGLPALGGFLFSPEACPDLDGAELSNGDMLEAIRCLAVTQESGRRTRVDYKNLASEEMGSVYESLLELHPDLSTDGTKFELRSASGNERKTTGSYYTPDSLIQCLLDSALDPVVDEAVRTARQKFQPKDGEPPEAQAILNLKVIDPAVGSGHFLIAAAHRMAKRLAQVRTGDDEPAPEVTRRALRDVIGRCLYGIDVNPMSAELCKVALWMEALEPGKPLSFLDHHIVVGNSLLGTTPDLIAAGIPDDAYTPIEGDDKKICTALKRQNKAERDGQGDLFSPEVYSGRGLLSAWERLEGLADNTLASVQEKAQRYREAKATVGMLQHLADAWCAAFVVPKVAAQASGARGITTATLQAIAAGRSLDAPTTSVIDETATRFRFLHPHVAFPDVFASGGFDVVLGNPPWEQIQFEPEEFFATTAPEIARAPNMAARNRMIALLPSGNPPLHVAYRAQIRHLNALQSFLHGSGRFPLTSFGRLNTASLFCELSRNLLNSTGRTGVIMPTGIATDSFNQYFFSDLVARRSIISLYDFENGMRATDGHVYEGEKVEQLSRGKKRLPEVSDIRDRRLFPGVHASFKFCLLTLAGQDLQFEEPRFAFFCHRVGDLQQPEKIFTLNPNDISLLNPNTKTCPVFRTRRDAEITKGIYLRVPVLFREGEPGGNPWGLKYQLMFMMNTASHLFRTREHFEAANGQQMGNQWHVGETTIANGVELQAGRWVPLYEAKMAQPFDHRAADVIKSETATARQNQPLPIPLEEKIDPNRLAQPFYWVHEVETRSAYAARNGAFVIGVTKVTSSTNARTFSPMCLPEVAFGDSVLLWQQSMNPALSACLYCCMASFVFDFVSRQKLGGVNMNYFIQAQQPTIAPSRFSETSTYSRGQSFAEWIVPRFVELAYTAIDMRPLADGMGYQGEPFRWEEERRFWLRAELDAAFFHLYGLGRSDVDYIMETFPIIKRKDVVTHGSYRTKEAIMGIYDAMAEAIRTGVPYVTQLNPPPANGWTLPPLEELMPKKPVTSATGVSGDGFGSSGTTPLPAKVAAGSEPEELLLTPPTPRPLRDKDGQEMRVRIYSASEEVLLQRGVAVGRRKNGKGTIWSVIPDEEAIPREFQSPPCIVKRLKPQL